MLKSVGFIVQTMKMTWFNEVQLSLSVESKSVDFIYLKRQQYSNYELKIFLL